MRKPKYTPRPLGLLLAWYSQGYSNVAAGGVCSRASLTSVCIMKFWELNILVNSYALVLCCCRSGLIVCSFYAQYFDVH